MPLLDDSLTLREISFRWADLDPDSLIYRFYIPSPVKDNIRLLTHAIITNVLWCKSLRPEKLLGPESDLEKNRANKFYDCQIGRKYHRDFLDSHSIYRADFAHWCNRSGIPFPEFWFPSGWAVHELNERDWLADSDTRQSDKSQMSVKSVTDAKSAGKRADSNEDIWKPARVAAQTIWSQDKMLTITAVVKHIKNMPELKASSFTESAIRKHIADLSPVPGKPGRKPSKKLT